MHTFTAPFEGVPDGSVYPKKFAAGDICPPELVAAAVALGALPDPAIDADAAAAAAKPQADADSAAAAAKAAPTNKASAKVPETK